MKHLAVLFALIGVCASSACTSGANPKVKADYEKICNAEKLSGAGDVADPSERATRMASWLKDNIETEEARRFMASLASRSPSSKGSSLRAEAKKAGVEPCPLAD